MTGEWLPAALPPPVVLVHGILGQAWLYWNLLRRHLAAADVPVSEEGLPRLALQSIRESAEALARSHEGLTGKRVFVAHSAGALACRWWLQFMGGEAHMAKLICLAAPHQGTRWSRLLPVEIARDTRPGSPLLNELARNWERRRAELPPVVNLWTRTDGVIVPSENGKLPGALNIEVPWVTHWGFLTRKKVFELVAALVKDTPHEPEGVGPQR